MKTFREFIIEARDTVKDATYTGDAAEQERIRQRDLKRGFDPDKERAEARRKAKEELLRNRSKNTTVPGGNKADSPFSGKTQPQPSQPSGGPQQTQTPPKSSTPPPPSSNPPKSSTPPSQPSGGSGGRGTPPPPPSSSTTTPSSGRRSNPYRATGTGRTEIPRSTTNPGKGPGAFQTVKNNAKNIKNFKPSSVPGLKSSGVLSGVVDTAVEKSRGSGWLRSLAKGTASALGAVGGGIAGGAAGSLAGPVGTAVGGYAGQAAGAAAAGMAFDTVAGANAVGRKQIATDNRKSQAGGGLVGTGGKTTFDTKKNTITSGGKTAQLGKTSVVTDPKTGKQGVGYLAYKGGKAVYKKPDTKSLAQTSSNPLERVGRSLFAGAYKANDAKLAAAKLKTAATSDASRNKQLGVKLKPGG
jgi:hypothetical protein